MQIYINKASASSTPDWRLAALKQDTSFEYVSENRLFSGSDGYTLSITFPLKDCPQNQAIFGHINRADVAAQKVIFDCEIRCKGFYKFGCITITEINEVEVKTQFLDGRSEQNFDKTLDKIYINELDLGEPSTTDKSAILPSEAWCSEDAVALQWVNNDSLNIQNCVTFVPEERDGHGHITSPAHFDWHADTMGLSWQPYLLHITKRICEQIGYNFDFSEWENNERYRFLLVCNSLPYSWHSPQFALALPHWSVKEFFEKLELFLGCEFDFDHRQKFIAFAFSKNIVASKSMVSLDNIVEDHSTEVTVEKDKCDYYETKNVAYADCSHHMWKFYSCYWFVKSWSKIEGQVICYDSMQQLLEENQQYALWDGRGTRVSNLNKLLYAADIDAYFIIRPVSRIDTGERIMGGNIIVWQYTCILQPVNLLGPRIMDDSEDAAQEEIEFVPACIDFIDENNGRALFLSPGGADEEVAGSYSRPNHMTIQEFYDRVNERFAQSKAVIALNAGEKNKKAEYYDKIYVAWWNGEYAESSTPPFPMVEDVVVNEDWSEFFTPNFSLRLNSRATSRSFGQMIEPSKKTTFKFLADSIPDVRAPFIIRGKRYVCEKLTATFSESGMSQLIKGVFYPVV